MALLTRRFTRQEYYRMAESGVFHAGERVELIDGEIVPLTSQNLPHANAVANSTMTLVTLFGSTHMVRCQTPLTFSDVCEPEPDFALVTPEHQADCNRRGIHPDRPDLVLELGDTSLSYDRREKSGIYARAGIAEYWVLNIRLRTLEVRRDPGAMPEEPFGHGYRSLQIVDEESRVSPLFAPEIQLVVHRLLGPMI